MEEYFLSNWMQALSKFDEIFIEKH